MDARTLSELRHLAAHASDCAQRTLDAADELHRRLNAAEDEITNQQATVRGLSAELRSLRGAS